MAVYQGCSLPASLSSNPTFGNILSGNSHTLQHPLVRAHVKGSSLEYCPQLKYHLQKPQWRSAGKRLHKLLHRTEYYIVAKISGHDALGSQKHKVQWELFHSYKLFVGLYNKTFGTIPTSILMGHGRKKVRLVSGASGWKKKGIGCLGSG